MLYFDGLGVRILLMVVIMVGGDYEGFVGGGGVFKKGVGAQVEAVREMPRPCLEEHAQAQRILPDAKSILTSTGVIAGNTLLNVLEQLLHKIKANRRREIGYYQVKEMRNEY